MPFYSGIDGRTAKGKRIAENLLTLKRAFEPKDEKIVIPRRNLDHNLLLATWNIREFESSKYGKRDIESLYYIAEIINRFDLVAVQEVRDDLSSLNRVLQLLGGWWKVLVTDVTEGRQGNLERMAFLYDSRKISFGGFTCEVVLPPIIKDGKTYEPARQLARTPFMVGFRAGWFKFTICTAHIYYGKAVADEPTRLEEIRILSETLVSRATQASAWAKNMILLGDFNIFDTTDQTFNAITSAGFVVPTAIAGAKSNLTRSKHYDQIAFLTPDLPKDKLELCDAGVFNFLAHLYRDKDELTYKEIMGEGYINAKDSTRYYRDWRTYQMSDHLPMWIELGIDFSESYLDWKRSSEIKPEQESLATPIVI